MDTLTQMLTALSLPSPSVRVYIDLFTHGRSTARMIAERLDIARPSVYDHLLPLTTLGLIDTLQGNGKTTFAIHDVSDLAKLIDEKQGELKRLRAAFDTHRERLEKRTNTIEPKIRFFSGADGIAQILRDMLWESEDELRTVWPYHEMLAVLGSEQLEVFNTKRIRHKIAIRSIWTKRVPRSAHIWQGGDWKVDRRYGPKGFAPSMGYSIYGERVSFISSKDELYGFIVRSRDFAKLMGAQFEILWAQSKA